MRAGATLVLWLVASAAFLPVASGFSRTSHRTSLTRFHFSQPHMGTTARVVLYTDTAATAQHLADRAFARIAELDARLSDYRPDSELMVFCRGAGGPAIPVSDDLHAVLSAAQRFARQTDGAFDVTIGPISRLWRRARVTGSPPDAGAIAAARALVGYQHLELSPGRARLAKPGMLLDLGGIAKGRAADEALRVLRDGGAPRALVALGGDIAAGDAPPGRDGWTIALAPLGPGTPIDTAPVILENAAVSTSGDAEQYLEHEGTRYSHLASPQTGDAVEGRRGVTVRARDGMTADALATAVSVLGNDRGLALVDATPATAALIVEISRGGIRYARSQRW